MRLFIRIKNGRAFQHPIFEDNFKEAFPSIDVDNLPDGYAEFIRVAPPTVGPYEIYEGVTYEWDMDKMKDVHRVRQMTAEEKTQKQNQVKESWAQTGFPSWVFDETTCAFIAPVSYPEDGKMYKWDEATTSWVSME